MAEKIIVGPIGKGLRTGIEPFNIDNDSFPTLINAYQWRGRLKRKRGTSLLNRLSRFFNSTSTSYNAGTTTFALVAGAGNILVNASWTLQSAGNIVPGSVTINNITIAQAYTDLTLDGILTGSIGGTGTINYATGAITISGGAGNSVNATFTYYPDLPVMGIEDFITPTKQFPLTLAFDTKYAYNIVTTDPYPIYDISFYKNPTTGTYAGYTQKTDASPTIWNGQDYQQFWTVNYQGAFFATNGAPNPFVTTNISMQFKPILTVDNITAGPPAFADLGITAHGLTQGDFVFINEVVTTTGINLQTGYVTNVVNANKVTVEFPNATIATNGTGGIAQYLTRQADTTKDCIRWYDGDPTDGNSTIPTLNGRLGWVNFCPPLSQSSFSIGGLPSALYYLVGARMIVPFKDRLLFIGPVVQTSSANSQVYLQDTVVYSQNGTPFYTTSFTGNAALATTTFTPILVPTNQVATPTAYWSDTTGFGGFVTAGIDEPINTSSSNDDVLIFGFQTSQARFVYTGNDVVPFNFFTINSEYGSDSTFGVVNLDRGVLTKGPRGFIMANQDAAVRFDLDIPDQVFQVRLLENGVQRFTSFRDFINEWVYFTYPSAARIHKFPNQTLQYNYRDQTWAIFDESYTSYGPFRRTEGYTWATVGKTFSSWNVWNEPWNAGSTTLLQPIVLAGNQQGFVSFRDDGTDEDPSLYITSIVGSTVTSPNHCLNVNDYIIITNCLGTVAEQVNGRIFQVSSPVGVNSFVLNPPIVGGTYLGTGVITRMYIPRIQSKQFPFAWGMTRKTRIGAQQYLLSTTSKAQIQLLIFLSQDSSDPYNDGPLFPDPNSVNDSLIYSTVLYTCPESTNLGLTPSNINLQMVTAKGQNQIWHRVNTSLLGDTIQVGFTLSETQMRSLTSSGVTYTITGASQATVCVLTVDNNLSANQLILISGVVGMTELNNNVYLVIAVTPTSVTLQVNSTTFTAYDSGGTFLQVAPINQFAEIEIHGFILDASPSMVLS